MTSPKVQIEKNPWTGGIRSRCLQCNKVAYKSEERVKRAVETIASLGTQMTHYLGPCGLWHLSHVDSR